MPDLSHAVPRETKRRYRSGGLCPCGNEQIVNGQGYGPKCHAEAQKRYRAKQRAELENLRSLAAKHTRRENA